MNIIILLAVVGTLVVFAKQASGRAILHQNKNGPEFERKNEASAQDDKEKLRKEHVMTDYEDDLRRSFTEVDDAFQRGPPSRHRGRFPDFPRPGKRTADPKKQQEWRPVPLGRF